MMNNFPLFKNNSQYGSIAISLIDDPNRNLCIKVTDGLKENIQFTDWDFFSALTKLRLVLEQDDLLIGCNGSLLNFYPSPLMLDMGFGKVGYLMQMNTPVTRRDVVQAFDIVDDPRDLATVEQQQLFHKKWSESITGEAADGGK